MTTVHADGQVIVFHRTRREAEAEAARLSESVTRQLVQREKTELDNEMDSVENWGVSLPHDLRALMHNGVAYHNAGLGARARRMVESLFLNGLVRVLCSTTTLASGMDLPARTVVITSISSRPPVTIVVYSPRIVFIRCWEGQVARAVTRKALESYSLAARVRQNEQSKPIFM